MSESLPAEIRVDSIPGGGTVYELPARPDFKPWRWLAVFPFLGVAVALGFLGFWAWGFVGGMVQIFGPWGWLGLLTLVPFLGGLSTVVWVVLLAVAGRTQLIVAEDKVTTREYAGWFRRSRRIQRSDIARLHVRSGGSIDVNGRAQSLQTFQNLAMLSAELTNGKTQMLAIGYPRDWLIPLSQELSHCLAVETPSLDSPNNRIPVTIVDATTGSGEIERDEQPPQSMIEWQALADGFVLTIPASGVRGQSRGLLTFSLAWCGIVTLFTVVFSFAGGQAQANPKDAGWVFAVVIGVFWAVGIGTLLSAINMSRRQAAIAISGDRLKLITSDLFGTKRKEWALDDVQTFRKGPSGVEVNDVPVMQLHIVPRAGSPYGLLTGRDEAELEWMATLLRRALPKRKSSPNEYEPQPDPVSPA